MKHFISVFLFSVAFSFAAFSQNFVGFSKTFIKKEIAAKKKDLKGPIEMADEANNYLSYVDKSGKRVVYYHFKNSEVKMSDGKTRPEEICYKYVSITKCRSSGKCPEKDKVINSLNSHYTKTGPLLWRNDALKKPQEWLIVETENHFEVHVTEAETAE